MENVSFFNRLKGHLFENEPDDDDDKVAIINNEEPNVFHNRSRRLAQIKLAQRVVILALILVCLCAMVIWCLYGLILIHRVMASSGDAPRPESFTQTTSNQTDIHATQKKQLNSSEVNLSEFKSIVGNDSEPFSNTSMVATDESVEPLSDLETVKKDSKMRAEFVKNMTIEAWTQYKEHAWGQDSLSPETLTSHNVLFGANSGRTLVSTMTTLWVMGLKEEFETAKEWVRTKLDLSKINTKMNVCDLVTDYIGSMLSCYALTKDKMFLDKAKEIADLLEPAYDTETGLPFEHINPALQTTKDPTEWLTYVGGQQLEYNYLADLTENTTFKERKNKMRSALRYISKPRGLYAELINVQSNKWKNDLACFSWATRQFFAGLVKSHIQTNQGDIEGLEMFNDAIDAAGRAKMFGKSEILGHRYVSPAEIETITPEYDEIWNYKSSSSATYDITQNGTASKSYMKYHACFLGGALSLVASLDPTTSRSQKYQQVGSDLTDTCYYASKKTKTGLAPWKFYFTLNQDGTNLKNSEDKNVYETGNFLNPELAESYFILWRQTKNPKYQEYAWQMVQAIYKHARTANGGYSQLVNVVHFPFPMNNYQPPYFLGGTLKFLFLIFAGDDILPSDKWIFNTVGQPLPIKGKNVMYPEKRKSVPANVRYFNLNKRILNDNP